MDNEVFKMLHRNIQRMKSQNMIESFTQVDFPNMSKENRRKVHRETFQIAYPESLKKRTVTTDDLLKMGFKGMESNG